MFGLDLHSPRDLLWWVPCKYKNDSEKWSKYQVTEPEEKKLKKDTFVIEKMIFKKFCEKCIALLFSPQHLKRSRSEISLCAYLMSFLITHFHVKEASSLKKNNQSMQLTIPCLTLSGNLGELQLLTCRRSAGNHRKENTLWVDDVSCIHVSPQIFCRTWTDH